jgi:hypothetical protein
MDPKEERKRERDGLLGTRLHRRALISGRHGTQKKCLCVCRHLRTILLALLAF